MKNLTLFLGILFLLFSCKSKQEEATKQTIEARILDCLYAQDENTGLKDSLARLENILFDNSILRGTSASDYKKLMSDIATGDIYLTTSVALLIEELGYIPASIVDGDTTCLSDNDRKTIEASKFASVLEFLDYLKTIPPHTELAEAGRSPRFNIKQLKTSNFKDDFYKTLALITTANLIVAQKDLYDYGMPLEEPVEYIIDEYGYIQIEKRNIFNLKINPEGKIMANETIVEAEEIKPMLKTFLLETSGKENLDLPVVGEQEQSKGIVQLTPAFNLDYKFFEPVIRQVEAAYAEIWDELAMKFFQVKFDKLNRNKRDLIKTIVPLKVSSPSFGIY